MHKFVMFFLMMIISVGVSAHQWTPTYPELKPAYMDGVLVADLELFNTRNDVEYFEVSVFDKDWKAIKFATTEKIFSVPFLKRKSISVYIREQDKFKITYICSKSKLLSEEISRALVSSRICSKIKL